jgi:phage-related protein
MANNPRKIDPTEAALSAIQEALEIRDDATKRESPAPEPTHAPAPAPEVRRALRAERRAGNGSAHNAAEKPRHGVTTDDDEEIFVDQPARGLPRSEEPVSRRPAANDDRQSIGQILQAVQHRPSRMSYTVATIFSVAWTVAGVGLAYIYLPQLQAMLAQGGQIAVPMLFGLGALFLAPVFFFYALAHMVTRSQELRMIAQSMAEVAIRLAEPETVARESIVSVGQAIRREVAAMGDGVERALARAAELEALVHNEVSALERAYNDNEVRIRGMLQDLASQRDTLVTQAEQVRNAITSVHLDLSQDITSVSDLVAERVSETAQRITHTLADKGEHITLALGRAGDSMITALTERGGDILERLETTSEQTTHAIGTATERMTASLNFKTDSIHEEFAGLANGIRHALNSQLDDVARDFELRSDAVVEMMGSRTQQMAASIIDSSTRIADTITNRVEEVNSTLKATGDSLVLDLSLRGGDVVSNLEQAGARITEALINRSGMVTDSFRENGEELARVVDAKGEAVKNMLAARLLAFEEMFSHGGAELGEKITRESTTLITRHLAEFDRTVKTYGGELVERLGRRTEEVVQALDGRSQTLDQSLGGRVSEIANIVDTRVSEITNAIDTRVSDITNSIDTRVSDITNAIDTRVSQITNVFDTRVSDITGAIDTRVSGITNAIDSRVSQITNVFDTRGSDITTVIDSRVSDITASIDKRVLEFGNVIESRGNTVTAALVSKISDIDRTMDSRATQVAASLDTRIGEIDRTLGSRAIEVASQLDARIGRIEELNASIKSHTGDAERTLTELSANISNTLKQNVDDVERTLLGVSEEVARSFISRADEIAASVSARATEMTTVLDQSSTGLLSALTNKSEEFASQVGRATDHALSEIEVKGFAFARSLAEQSADIARGINEASVNATVSVTRTLQDLQEASQVAIEQSKQTATATVSEMLETHGMLRSDTTTLFERLREANILLQEVLSGAHENMSSLENTLVSRVSEFVESMNKISEQSGAATSKVDEQIGQFSSVTARVLGDLGQFATQFEAHGRGLAEAVDLIDRSNRRTEEALGERRTGLESLVSTLDIRSDDLEQRLKRLTGLLDETLETASGRAREIARIVSESSTGGAQAIAEQFDLVRTTVEEERQRTADTMRSIYDDARNDTSAIFRQYTERFTEVISGMKHMASEMQRELETTRAELRRGILELPQETAESAAQMRRVIVDQIEALAELNRIVARHGRGLDVVEPARRNGTTNGREESLHGGYGGERERMDVPREVPRETPRPALRRELPGASLTGSSNVNPSPRRPEPSPSVSPAASNARASGWLSDLLQRASRDDDPSLEIPRETVPREVSRETSRDERTAAHSIESLDSLSVDIARMIDHNAATELWDKYKRGERNVFTRRLYTLQGQKAFDDISKKYRADREFRQTVDRYITEFERLLDEVSRDDRGQVVARTYLTSETGKVYTMLAHAAGRFE